MSSPRAFHILTVRMKKDLRYVVVLHFLGKNRVFYREQLEYFNNVKKNSLQDTNSKFILWNNQNITIEGNPVFWKQWFDSSILFFHDLLNSEGIFVSLNEFQRKFKLKIIFFAIFSISAIPSDLKKQAFESPYTDLCRDSLTSPTLEISEDVDIVLKKLRCKNYYKLINLFQIL